MYRHTPTPVGSRGYLRSEARSTISPIISVDTPAGNKLSSRNSGSEQIVALLERGVTVAMSGTE